MDNWVFQPQSYLQSETLIGDVMGVCYKIWLRDNFNWNYKNYSKDKLKNEVLKIVDHAEFLGDFDTWLIVDIGKTLPYPEKFKSLVYDDILVSDDNSTSLPIKIED
ncbi:hypothetical protein MNBD_GAMMA01-1291 [hydrothermal vent metagenome]|uniref:Uncharacterized protein n=1 Tax=hydrothermal vent metagenome TaxID=652676 RepID=A0A3B0VPR8_9ZZZZ